jgi:hypothetical protein
MKLQWQVTLDETSVAGHVLSNNQNVSKQFDFLRIGITNEQRDSAWSIVTINLNDAYQLATKIRNGFGHVGYAPSILRDRPCLEIGGRITAPIVELVFNRATETLFYDFVGDGGLREEFGRNFESYVEETLKDRAEGFDVLREVKYGTPQRATPDLFLKDAAGVKIAMELKSRKLPVIARFGEDPVAEAEDAFKEIAKGICQLWKYIEDSISDDVPLEVRANDATSLVLVCLEEWLGMSDPVDELVRDRAHAIADEKGISKDANVRRYVQFCTADDLEYVLEKGDVNDFVNVIEQSSLLKYKGWGISSIRDDVLGKKKRDDEAGSRTRGKIGEILNWWNESFTDAKT